MRSCFHKGEHIHVDVWCLRRKKFFAGFGCKCCIIKRQDNVTDRYLPNSLVFLDLWRKIVLLNISGTVPRSEEAVLSEVSIAKESVIARTRAPGS